MSRIAIIQGHPDASQPHFGHALALAYTQGATAAGHEVRAVDITRLDFPLLRSKQDWEQGATPVTLRAAQETIAWADHLVIVYPLWLGGMPAMLKAFLEQIARPGFAFGPAGKNPLGKQLLKGRSARIVVTMGMPALLYRWYFRAHSLKSLERNILGFVGIAPIRATVIGMVESPDTSRRDKWLVKLRELGARAS